MSNYYKSNVQYYCFLKFKNKIYNTYRDLHTRIILNNVLKITLDNETYTDHVRFQKSNRLNFLLHSNCINC